MSEQKKGFGANFRGESVKGVDLYISSVFDDPNKPYVNLAVSVRNDVRDVDNAKPYPMLNYNSFIDKDGNERWYHTIPYSRSQYEKMKEVANMDGDKPAFKADLVKSSKYGGWAINTKTLQKTDAPFDYAKHRENTLLVRDAQKTKQAEQQAENVVEAEPEMEPS